MVKKALQVMEPQAIEIQTPNQMIAMAVSRGSDLSQIRELLALQKEWEANEARKAYHQAMADFKAEAPLTVEKKKKVKFETSKGTVKYSHAELADVVEAITGKLSKHGLTVSWPMNQSPEGKISVSCQITHAKGHSEVFTLTAGADDSGSKNSIQAICSTITYLQRYTLLAATGLATKGQDDDGKAAESPKPEFTPSTQKTETTKPDTKAEYGCSECGAGISFEVSKYSQKVYGKKLCRTCQGKAGK